MPDPIIGSGGSVEGGGAMRSSGPSEAQQNKAIQKGMEFPDEMAQADAATNISQSFEFAGKHTIQKQAKAAVNEQPYVLPPEGEIEEVNEVNDLVKESKVNPLFQNVIYLRIVDNGYEIQKMLSWNTLSELEFQINAMKNELDMAKSIGKVIRKTANVEAKGLHGQASLKLIGAGTQVYVGHEVNKSGSEVWFQPLTQATSQVFDAGSSFLQAEFVVKKAEKEARREVYGTYQKQNERILQNAAEGRQKNSNEVPKMLDSVRQMLNELYRTFGKLGGHG